MARKVVRTLTITGRLVSLTPDGAAWAARHCACLLLTHHPWDWLAPQSKQNLVQEILGGKRFALHLCGHMHETHSLVQRTGGGEPRRLFQARSLFGLEKLGNGIDRRHGCVAGRLQIDNSADAHWRAWPRKYHLAGDDWDIIPDPDIKLDRASGGTQAGEVPLGAAATRGLGRVKLVGAQCTERDWGTPEGILGLLSEAPDTDCRSVWQAKRDQHALSSPPRIRIEIHWKPKGPLMSRSARDGVVVDSLPFVSRRDDGQHALVLPGAGIKGAWRAHAERIVRTLLDRDEVPEKHHEQVDVPLVSEVFGCARRPDPKVGRAAGGPPAKGRLAFETCYARFALPSEQWDALEREEARWRAPPSEQRPMAMAMHVAVDRWTGGAADSLLYSAVEPMGIAWEPIVLHLKLTEKPRAQLALLWLVLRDFCGGRIPLGYGVNRGYGDLTVEQVRIDGLDAVCDGCPASVTLEVADHQLNDASVQHLVALLTDAWATWLRAETEGAAA